MVRIVKKRALFMVGVLLTTIVGSVSSLVKTNFSKEVSFFVDIAHADIPAAPTGGEPAGGDSGAGAGGGAGAGADAGCSDGSY